MFFRKALPRNALLTEVHTYNRRYSGEPRSLPEMIRFDKFIYSLKICFSGTFLYCCATLSTTWSVGRASTLPSSSGLKFPNSSLEVENHWEFKISRLVRFPKTIHSTPFLDLQPPDIHFTLDLWRTWGRWLKALQVITCTFSPQGSFPGCNVAALSPLPPWPDTRGCIWNCRLSLFCQTFNSSSGWSPGWPCDIHPHLHVPYFLLQVQSTSSLLQLYQSKLQANYGRHGRQSSSRNKPVTIWSKTFMDTSSVINVRRTNSTSRSQMKQIVIFH